MQIEGVYSVVPTPFLPGGDVDTEGLAAVVALAIDAGVSGLTALGVTAEVARLTENERRIVLDTVIAAADGRVPVVANTSADGLRPCIEATKRAREAGASAVMISPPRMAKLNSEAVVAHFAGVAMAADTSIVIQDYPPVSGYAMEPALLVRIAREIPTARTIKLEDPPTPLKTARIREAAAGLPLGIFGGLGGIFLLEELMAGATGAMTGFAFPEILVDIVKRYFGGDIDGAAQSFYDAVPLMRFEFQEGIGTAIRKEALRRRGVIACADVRAPGAPFDAHTAAALDRVLAWTEKRYSGH